MNIFKRFIDYLKADDELLSMKKKMINDLHQQEIEILDTAIKEDRELTEMERVKLDILSLKIQNV